MNDTFFSLGLSQALCDALGRAGLIEPTPVQRQTIPPALNGNDVIVQAQTGTGKTMAFLLPILERAAARGTQEGIGALVLTPTRELAIQITAEARGLAEAVGLSILPVYGGQDVIAQAHKLDSDPDLVIATPGRLLDHMRRGTVSLDALTVLVLDEADQMLHLGFLPEVEDIIDHTPYSRQTMLFSATFPQTVRTLAERYLRNPVDIRIQGKRITLEAIRQYVVKMSDRQKKDTLLTLLWQDVPERAVIFCRTKIRVKKLAEMLASERQSVDELHGDLTQPKREDVMQRFRNGDLRLLVATDVAARGLDIDGITHVYNYDIPHDTDSYIHRIGRTGRAGRRGTAITLAAPRDEGTLLEIEQGIGTALELLQVELGTNRPRETERQRSQVVRDRQRGQTTSSPRAEGGRWQGRDDRRQGRDDRAPAGSGSRRQSPSDGRTTGRNDVREGQRAGSRSAEQAGQQATVANRRVEPRADKRSEAWTRGGSGGSPNGREGGRRGRRRK